MKTLTITTGDEFADNCLVNLSSAAGDAFHALDHVLLPSLVPGCGMAHIREVALEMMPTVALAGVTATLRQVEDALLVRMAMAPARKRLQVAA